MVVSSETKLLFIQFKHPGAHPLVMEISCVDEYYFTQISSDLADRADDARFEGDPVSSSTDSTDDEGLDLLVGNLSLRPETSKFPNGLVPDSLVSHMSGIVVGCSERVPESGLHLPLQAIVQDKSTISLGYVSPEHFEELLDRHGWEYMRQARRWLSRAYTENLLARLRSYIGTDR